MDEPVGGPTAAQRGAVAPGRFTMASCGARAAVILDSVSGRSWYLESVSGQVPWTPIGFAGAAERAPRRDKETQALRMGGAARLGPGGATPKERGRSMEARAPGGGMHEAMEPFQGSVEEGGAGGRRSGPGRFAISSAGDSVLLAESYTGRTWHLQVAGSAVMWAPLSFGEDAAQAPRPREVERRAA